jgi:hypothetical protein
MHEITIIDTMEMVEEFERGLGYQICQEDRLQIFQQLFWILDSNTPLDLTDRNILDYSSLIFANHLSVNHEAVDKLAYHLMVRLWPELRARGFYIDGALMYIPFSMQGWDLCVRRCKN